MKKIVIASGILLVTIVYLFGAQSSQAQAATLPAEPTFFATCTKYDATRYRIILTWNKVSGATEYPIRLKSPSGIETVIGNPPQNTHLGTSVPPSPTGSYYFFSDLKKAGTYTYWGHAWNSAGWSGYTQKTVTCGTSTPVPASTATSTTQPAATGSSNNIVNLDNVWNGTAHFVPYQNLPWMAENPTSVQVVNGTWYMFGRKQIADSEISGCSGLGVYLIQVRKSTDKGKTWSEPIVVADPRNVPGTPLCSYVDSDAEYDAVANKWVLITQCLLKKNGSSEWDLCALSLNGSNPMSTFTPNSNNPVVRGGKLWSQICAQQGSGCEGKKVVDEGTPHIEAVKDGYYYVSFHGYIYATGEGYRGMAKTKNFTDWVTTGSDLPSGAMFTKADCSNANCIGAGVGSLLSTANYTYLLAETPTLNLACMAGQAWPVTLYRSSSFTTKTGGWTSYSSNPLISSLDTSPCSLQYASFIKDGNDLYLIVSYNWQGSNPVAIFKLVAKTAVKTEKIVFNGTLINALDTLIRTQNTSPASTPNPTASMFVTPTVIASAGTYTRFGYSSTNAHFCNVFKNGTLVWKYAPLAKSGTPQEWGDTSPYTKSTTWSLECYNTAGEKADASATLTVGVVAANVPIPVPVPTVSMSVSPSSITSGSLYSNFQYSSTNASYCNIYKNGSLVWANAPTAKTGAPSAWNDAGPYTVDTTWRAECFNSAGVSGSASATLRVTTPSATTPSVTVTSPNGGESYSVGSSVQIAWSSVGSNRVFVNWLQDRDNNGTYETVYGLFGSNSQPATGSGSWTVPATINSLSSVSTRNKISVGTTVLSNGTVARDESNSNFTITAQAVIPPPTVTMSVTPTTISAGTLYSNFQYSSTNASYCNIYKNGSLVWANAPTAKTGAPSAWNDAGPYTVDTTWRAECFNSAGVSGSASATLRVTRATGTIGTPQGTNCVIPAGSISCSLPISWQVTNPVAGAATNISRVLTSSAPVLYSTQTGTAKPVTVFYGSLTVRLTHNGNSLNEVSLVGSCASGTAWNGSQCKLSTTLPPATPPPGTGTTPPPTVSLPAPTVTVTNSSADAVTISYVNAPANAKAIIIDKASNVQANDGNMITEMSLQASSQSQSGTLGQLRLQPGRVYSVRIINSLTQASLVESNTFTIAVPTITLQTPQSGSYTTAQSLTISGSGTNMPKYGTVFVALVNSSIEYHIGSQAVSGGSFSITVNPISTYSVKPGSYFIRAWLGGVSTDPSGSKYVTESTGLITITAPVVQPTQPVVPVAPTITLISPNGGELIPEGAAAGTYPVCWTQTGLKSGVSLSLYKNDNFFAWATGDANVIAGVNTPGTNQYCYNWKVGTLFDLRGRSVSTLGSIFKLSVSGRKLDGTSGSVADRSDKAFAFVSASTAPTVLGASSQCVNLIYNHHRGHESANVRMLQTFLSEQGLLGEVTGFYGDKTIGAVKAYQQSKGLPQTGMVYERTREAIKKDSCSI